MFRQRVSCVLCFVLGVLLPREESQEGRGKCAVIVSQVQLEILTVPTEATDSQFASQQEEVLRLCCTHFGDCLNKVMHTKETN